MMLTGGYSSCVPKQGVFVKPLKRLKGTLCSKRGLHALPRASVNLPSSKYTPMAETYDPTAVEKDLYQWWEESGVFEANRGIGKPFSMVIPPPNVTGALHIGHALTVTIQDCLVRWRRMHGDDVLWIPGLDHAGIATQSVVERNLEKTRGLNRHDLGRDEFVKEVYKWNDKYGGRICEQLKRLGASLNWDRQVFTLDEKRNQAVKETFVRLWRQGLVYRGTRMVNWCPHLQTALSDIEVDVAHIASPTKLKVPSRNGGERLVEVGWMETFCYPVVDPRGRISLLEVSTTRLETMLGDVALAVHPDDERYKHLVGSVVIHPLQNLKFDPFAYTKEQLKDMLYGQHSDNRLVTLPVIADSELVDPNVGTGVVKVTPAHDSNDFACAQRHDLPISDSHIINNLGTMNGNCGRFHGMDRFDARNNVREALREKQLFVSQERHEMSIPRCSRSGDILEPMLKPQWFVRCDSLAKQALQLTKKGSLQILPANPFETLWKQWLENIHDWCVSRQLWWGHRIPAYRVVLRNNVSGDVIVPTETTDTTGNADGIWIVGRSEDEALAEVSREYTLSQLLDLSEDIPEQDTGAWNIALEQDEDVLDTWFSSAIFPLSVFGFPNEEQCGKDLNDYQRYYPLSVMETGSDILFFWVARMAMLCKQLVDETPFKTVYLHPVVRDRKGQKMSKSLGNVVDPTSIMDGKNVNELLNELEQNSGIRASEKQSARTNLQKEFPNGIPTCGTDALRLCLGSYLQQGVQINMDVKRAQSYRHFCNKIWNASRLILSHASNGKAPRETQAEEGRQILGVSSRPLEHYVHSLSLCDRWILSQFSRCCEEVDQSLDKYDFANAVRATHSFFLYSLCDVYLEWCKPIVGPPPGDNASISKQTDEANAARVKSILCLLLDGSLRLLHPLMPFLTEEIWQRLKGLEGDLVNDVHPRSIATAKFPTHDSLWQQLRGFADSESDRRMELVLEAVRGVRELKQTFREVCGKESGDQTLQLISTNEAERELLVDNLAIMVQLPGMARAGVSVVGSAQEGDDVPVLRVRISDSIEGKFYGQNEAARSLP
eukprot:gb/GECG01014301.1/.p1 GENE.gb/GECG01014301.1/~~gb/GECG01014301.1/.p1  ORF type:complete len:1058 (+),score=114.58 gb/GECG01014301.1/:1-3174(+)